MEAPPVQAANLGPSGIRALSGLLHKAKKALRLLGRKEFRLGLRYGIAASIEHSRSLAGLKLQTIVDVGANVGQFALLAHSLYPTAHIYSFEPQRTAAKKYAQLFSGVDVVRLYESAIGRMVGKAVLHVSHRDDSSSLLPIGEAQAQVFPGTEEVGVLDIAIAPLANFLSPADLRAPALLKIDVQGGEMEVIRGCEYLLRYFAYIYVELSFVELYVGQALCDEVIAYLRERNFNLSGIYNLYAASDGRAIQADFFFSHNRGASSHTHEG